MPGPGRAPRALVLALTTVLTLACGSRDAAPPGETAAGASGQEQLRPGIVPTFGKAFPVDEGPRDPEFAALRDGLLRIVALRDTTALLALLVPDVKNSFGGDDGIQGFRDHWRLGEPDTELWTVLGDVLRHGGKFTPPGRFAAPWTFFALPDSLDAFEYLIVRDSAVAVHERADVTSRVIARLSFDIVRAGPYQPGPWRAIALADSGSGYVQASRIRSPVDYRAAFERREGRWRLVFLVAGD